MGKGIPYGHLITYYFGALCYFQKVSEAFGWTRNNSECFCCLSGFLSRFGCKITKSFRSDVRLFADSWGLDKIIRLYPYRRKSFTDIAFKVFKAFKVYKFVYTWTLERLNSIFLLTHWFSNMYMYHEGVQGCSRVFKVFNLYTLLNINTWTLNPKNG